MDPRIAALLPAGSQELFAYLREARMPLGTGDLAEATRVSRPVVLERLRVLKNAGLVRWLGRNRNDPRAVWTAAE